VRINELICHRRQAEFLKFRNTPEWDVAATSVDHEVHAEAEVVKVLDERIEFKVSAHDESQRRFGHRGTGKGFR
jgi:hypothetical protein